MEELAAFALEVAQCARAETLHRWTQGCAAENKADAGFDPVTEADRSAEQAMRRLIADRFPDHGIRGEEWPERVGANNYAWSLDPVDGTRSFICGLPTWTTLIAILDKNVPTLGLIDAPAVDETYFGFGSEACLLRESERVSISTSGCTRIADARVSTTDPFLFDEAPFAAFDKVQRAARTARYGHDGYAYGRLAAGGLDLIVESGLKPHDYNPLIPLISAAGGVVGDWRGGQDYEGGKIIAASTRELFEEALGYFEALA